MSTWSLSPGVPQSLKVAGASWASAGPETDIGTGWFAGERKTLLYISCDFTKLKYENIYLSSNLLSDALRKNGDMCIIEFPVQWHKHGLELAMGSPHSCLIADVFMSSNIRPLNAHPSGRGQHKRVTPPSQIARQHGDHLQQVGEYSNWNQMMNLWSWSGRPRITQVDLTLRLVRAKLLRSPTVRSLRGVL